MNNYHPFLPRASNNISIEKSNDAVTWLNILMITGNILLNKTKRALDCTLTDTFQGFLMLTLSFVGERKNLRPQQPIWVSAMSNITFQRQICFSNKGLFEEAINLHATNSSGQYIVANNFSTIKVYDSSGKFVQCFSLPPLIGDSGEKLSMYSWFRLATDMNDNINVLVEGISGEDQCWIFKFNKNVFGLIKRTINWTNCISIMFNFRSSPEAAVFVSCMKAGSNERFKSLLIHCYTVCIFERSV